MAAPDSDEEDALCRPCGGAMEPARREAVVDLQDMKFCAAHFVAYRGFREALHGHNYTVGVRVQAPKLQADGYLIDFSDLKKTARAACKRLDQRTLLPAQSDVLQFRQEKSRSSQVHVDCEDGSSISLPAADCVMLPLVHTTAEELAEYLWDEIVVSSKLCDQLVRRDVDWLEVIVSERPGQRACFRKTLLKATGDQKAEQSKRPPSPCLAPAAVAATQYPLSAGTSLVPSRSHLPSPAADSVLQTWDPHAEAEAAFRRLIDSLGADEASRPELIKTPARAAKAWHELTSGIHIDPISAVGEGIFEVDGAQDLVAVRDIPFNSLCEHHLLPFWGSASVAYIPNGRVLGLSKFARLLKVFARRLQLQERLSQNFAEALVQVLSPRGVAVAIEGRHACMSMRGIGAPAVTRTVVLRGVDKDDPAVREMLLAGVNGTGQAAKL